MRRLLLPVGVFLAALGAATFAADAPSLTITRDPICAGQISPLQYGQFVEYLCDLVPSMWGEKLYDGGFEGLSPYKFVYIKETDFKEKPWYPSGETNRGKWTLDDQTKVGGNTSQRIETVGDSPCTVGISQDGIFAKSGEDLRFACWLRAKDMKSAVRVFLHKDGKVLAETSFQPTGDWQKFSATLKPTDQADSAAFTFEFHGPGTFWIDDASLMPGNTVGGWRPQAVAAVRDLHPGIIRFGGSALEGGELGDFQWTNSIGDPDHRPAFRAWGGLQPAGAGLEELVQFFRACGAEPLICVRFSGRTPQDAADEVEYFNGAATTRMGALRAKNGHAEPYAIRYWQIGNEISSPEYDAKVAGFAQAMKRVDPSIKVLSSFPTPGVIRNAGQSIDFVCPHYYSQDLAGMEQDIVNIGRMIHDNAPPDRADKIKIAVTEWNTTGGDAGPGRAMLWSLQNALACSRYQDMLHRHCDLVQVANRSNLANSFCSGIIQSDRAGRMFKTPTYCAQQLYATMAGSMPLKIADTEKDLDVSATLSADGRVLTIFVVNSSSKDVRRDVDLSAFKTGAAKLIVRTLGDRNHADEPDVANSFENPDRVGVMDSTVELNADCCCKCTFPALTLTVMRGQVP